MHITPFCLLHTSISSPEQALQLLAHKLPCGFPSPADDYLENMPSLDELLIKHPAATIIGRASGDSMIERGILDGSYVVIDRSIEPKNNATIVASICGELTIKIVDKTNKLLRPANKNHQPIPLPEDLDVLCEGTITYAITPQSGFAFPC